MGVGAITVTLWPEAISGRFETDTVIFWADNCTGQNKNWTLYTVLCRCVNQNWSPQSITTKYFERGHTFMCADNDHGSIGRKMKKCPKICTFQDFIDVCD